MRDDEGVLVGIGRLDPGGKAVLQRQFGLVFVDRAREVSGRRRRHPGLRDQKPLQPDGIDIVIGNSRRGGQHAGRQRFLGNAGISPRQRLGLVDRVDGEAAAPGILLVALVFHQRRGVRDGDYRAIAARANSLSSVAFGGAVCTREAVGAVGYLERVADEGCGAVAVGQHRDLLFLSSASDLIFLLPGLISSTRSCLRMASARARGGTLASVRSTARSACRDRMRRAPWRCRHW